MGTNSQYGTDFKIAMFINLYKVKVILFQSFKEMEESISNDQEVIMRRDNNKIIDNKQNLFIRK